MKKYFNIFSVSKSVVLVSIAIALTLFGDSILYNVLPIYAESLGIPLVAVGVLLSINRWIRLLTNPLAAKNFQSFGSKKPLIISTFLGIGVIFIYADGRNVIIFLLARIIWGLCWSHLRLGSFLVVMGKSEDNLGLTMGSMNAIRRLGSTFTVLFGGFLIDNTGYRSGMIIIAVAASLAIPIMYKACSGIQDNIGQEEKKVKEVNNTKEKKQIEKKIPTEKLSPLICYLTIFVTSFIAGFVISSLSLILQDRLGSNFVFLGTNIGIATITGIMLAVRYSSYSILSPLTGAFTDLWGSNRIFTGVSIILMVSLFIFALIPTPLLTIIMVTLIFFASTSLETILNTAIAESVIGKKAPRRLSIYTSYQDIGSACGPLLGYIVGVYVNFIYAYSLGVIGLLVIIVCKLLGVFTIKEDPELENNIIAH